MARFPCHGVFLVTLRDGYFDCALDHSLDHLPYNDIRVPDEWIDFIKENHKLGPTIVSVPHFIQLVTLNKLVKIWREILQDTTGGKGVAFTQKAVHYAWIREGSQLWQCADDPIESAREWCQQFGAHENIEMLEMGPVPHSKSFAFVVKDFIDAWARHTVSFLVDSTCEYFKYPSFHFQDLINCRQHQSE